MTNTATKEKETATKDFVPEFPSEIVSALERGKFKKYEYGWVFEKELDKLITEMTGIKNVTCGDLAYALKNTTTAYILDTNLNIIPKNIAEKGFPIKFYDMETGELLGFVYIESDIMDDYIHFEEKSDLDEFYNIFVDSQSEDIKFQYMVKLLS